MPQKYGMPRIQLAHRSHTYIILLANNFLEKEEEKKKDIDNIEQLLGKISDQYNSLTLTYTDMTGKGWLREVF